MTKRTTFVMTALFALLFTSGATLACDAMGKSTHMGQLMSVNPTQKTFTIRDAQSQSPVTFTANTDILTGLKDASGNIMVNYEEKDGGGLNAVGVTF